MTNWRRMEAVVEAVRYCQRRNIPGAFVECGVWRGGSVLAMILTLQEFGTADREIYLFDTFDGMSEPTEQDTSIYWPGDPDQWLHDPTSVVGGAFAEEIYPEDSVRQMLLGEGYPADRLHLVRGPVEETLPVYAPEQLALLRLDTDWYESTRHELVHMYPRLAVDGS